MARPKFICLYVSYLDSIVIHSYETRGKLLTAMLEYASTGQEVKVPKSVESFWISMRQQIDRDLEKYEQICEANRIKGAKGGRAPRKATASTSLPEQANEKEKENEKENIKEKEKKKEKEKERENKKENTIPGSGDEENAPAPFIPPNSEEVKNYVYSKGLSMDVDLFMDHYTSNGWMVGSNPMKDWKAAVRNWNRKESKFGKTESEQMEYNYGHNL